METYAHTLTNTHTLIHEQIVYSMDLDMLYVCLSVCVYICMFDSEWKCGAINLLEIGEVNTYICANSTAYRYRVNEWNEPA